MPAGSRAAAVDALKQSLIRRFGTSATDVVEEHVAVLRKQPKLAASDIDAIERSILAVLKQKRWGGSMQRSRSAAGPLSSGAGSVQNAGASIAKSASGPISPVSVRSNAPSVQRPDSCASSRYEPPPKYPVPKRPLAKPNDHWDLILRYDRAKYEEEELTRMRGRRGGQAEYRAELDQQMAEIRERQEEGVREKQQERQIMIAEEKRRKDDDEAHLHNIEEKRKFMNSFMTEMLGGKERREKREIARSRRDRAELLERLAAEDEIERIQKAQAREKQQRRAVETRQMLKDVTLRKAENKAAEAARDKAMVKRYIADLDEKEVPLEQAIMSLWKLQMSCLCAWICETWSPFAVWLETPYPRSGEISCGLFSSTRVHCLWLLAVSGVTVYS